MKKNFDVLLDVVVEEYADTLQADYQEVKEFILKLYNEEINRQLNEHETSKHI